MRGRRGRAEPSGSRPGRTSRSPAASLKPPPSQRVARPPERPAHARRRSEEAVPPMPLLPNSGDHACSLPRYRSLLAADPPEDRRPHPRPRPPGLELLTLLFAPSFQTLRLST